FFPMAEQRASDRDPDAPHLQPPVRELVRAGFVTHDGAGRRLPDLQRYEVDPARGRDVRAVHLLRVHFDHVSDLSWREVDAVHAKTRQLQAGGGRDRRWRWCRRGPWKHQTWLDG